MKRKWTRFGASGLLIALAAAAGAQQLPDNVARGKATYQQRCAACHGPNMVNSGTTYDLRSFPLDQQDRFFDSVLNGKNQMPPWKDLLQRSQVEAIWDYVNHVQKTR